MDRHQKHLGGLPFHLSLAAWEWMSLHAALQIASAGSPFLNPSFSHPGLQKLRQFESLLQASGIRLEDPRLADVLRHEANCRLTDLLRGIHAYQSRPPEETGTEHEVVEEIAGARLLHYPPLARSKRAATIFLVPSLINRYYILDLNRKLSFVRFLQENGHDCYILDWGTPVSADHNKNCEHYILETLVPLLASARKRSKGKLVLTGYCMGGLLALAAAQLKPKLLDALALFATPWDFYSSDFFRLPFSSKQLHDLEKTLDREQMLSGDTVQMLFYASNPWVFHEKFRRFADLADSAQAKDFLAIEQWVNDGVPMTAGLAKECLIGWAQRNDTAAGNWTIAGKRIDPGSVRHLAFLAIPQDDRIVPSGCALPLASLLRRSYVIAPASGHVGMIVGTQRRSGLWNPFAQWVASAHA